MFMNSHVICVAASRQGGPGDGQARGGPRRPGLRVQHRYAGAHLIRSIEEHHVAVLHQMGAGLHV